MPLVAHNKLPTFSRLQLEGETVLTPDRAAKQDIREMHIGLLNMMPDAALAATERQFFRLVGESNLIVQFYIHPFTIPELPRGDAAREHIEAYYDDFSRLREDGLDALIITGANVTGPELDQQVFWEPLIEIIDWALDNVTSVLCSCLATHAVMQFRYGQKRRHMGHKRWGVFRHRVLERDHPLVADVNTVFDVPHSRFNDISREQFEAAATRVLVASEKAGVHLAVSEDLFRVVFFQGHPEYDTVSLLKEYKREVKLRLAGKRDDWPPFPDNYFSLQCEAILDEYRQHTLQALARGDDLPAFPENTIVPRLDNTWHDTAEAIINNWIGTVYQLTSFERKMPFAEGIDPEDPLQLRTVL